MMHGSINVEDSNIVALAHDPLYRGQSSYLWVFCIRNAVGNMRHKGSKIKNYILYIPYQTEPIRQCSIS